MLKTNRLVKKIWCAIILWLVGFFWGIVLFMVPLNRRPLLNAW